VEVEQVEKILN